MKSYSLFELNEYIKRVIALNFEEAIWIKAEISQVKESRGNVYIDLIQKDERDDSVIAQASAAIWYKSLLFIKKKLGELTDSILQDGIEVNVKVKVGFHERYGMKLSIEDIDASYTMGQVEINRQKIIERLKKAELLERNAMIYMPPVLQRIAIIASETSAGYKDFEAQLANNGYGYIFHTTLFHVAVQGRSTSDEVSAALKEIHTRDKEYDVAIIIRGGGSKIDLSGFDDYNIGHAIATNKVPIITGIGHEIDLSVADIVAHTYLKTPTAVANFIIDHNLHFEAEIDYLSQQISNQVSNRLKLEQSSLDQIEHILSTKPLELIKWNDEKLDQIKNETKQATKYLINKLKEELKNVEQLITAVKPENILKKGFSYIQKNDKVIGSKKHLKSGDLIDIVFVDGKKSAEIK